MNTGLFSHGKLHLLPRAFVSYRQLNFTLTRVITWLVMLTALTGQVSAAYTPTNVAELLSTAKPVVTVKTIAILTPTVPVAPVSTPTTPEIKTVQPAQFERPTPEIKIEIFSAEYVPPAPKPVVKPQPQVTTSAVTSFGNSSFPFGQCTYYVATRRNVTWSGNAWQWFGNAQAAGLATGQQPRAGAIMVSWESAIGHVAYVEAVTPDGSFRVSEMNYGGYGSHVTSRTIRVSDVPLIGFIY